MLEARSGNDAPERGDAGDGVRAYQRERKLPVVIILHQPHSTPGHIGRWLVEHGHALDIRKPRYGDPLPRTLQNHAGAVIFGGPMSANDDDDFIRLETDWIGVALKEDKPFFGICLGAQMLARHLGARVDYHPEAHVEIGYQRIEPTEAGRQVCAWPEYFYQWHREGFDVPRGGSTLVRGMSNSSFPNQAFAYGRTAFGVQFHPEITYAQVNRWTGFNRSRLLMRGAQPRPDQISHHLLLAPRVHAWLDRIMPLWLDGRVGAG